jgi:tRNA pseudouridine13 synthase
MQTLAQRGVPNRFGDQRFGRRDDGDRLGSALVRGAWDEFLHTLLGSPLDSDPPASRASRELFESGKIREAMRALPSRQSDEHKALRSLVDGADAQRAVRSIPKRARLFMISAFQSRMFNAVLEGRLDSLDTVEAGDLAYKHDSGAVFLVEDALAEASRAKRFEISPSGPMFGYKTLMPGGRQRQIEQDILDEYGVTLESFKTAGGLKSKGERRPLRVKLTSPCVEEEGEDIWLSFGLPPGSYATTVLDEVMKC